MPPLRGVTTLVRGWKLLKAAACHGGCRRCSGLRSYSQYGCCSQEEEEEVLPTAEWYRAAYPRLIKLACALKNVDQVDGRITGIDDDGLVITDDRVISDMQMFKWLARAFVGSPSTQGSMNKTAAASCTSPGGRTPAGRRREPTTLDSLTRVCNSLNISAQQRKSVRLTVCPQVTQHHIWRAALEEVLKNAGSELQQHAMTVGCSPSIRMAEQIVSSCVQLLADTTGPSEQETPLWMQLAPEKKKKRAHKPPVQMRKWAEVLEMFEDFSRCLLGKEEEKYLTGAAVGKIEVMKEGLYQIKDLLVEREIGYKEARRQDCLVQKNLSKNLGHSSKCLFTLLLHYLFGSVRDVEVDAYRFSATDGGHLMMVAGKILTSDHERVLRCGLKQVDRALGVSKFVWEAAGSKGGPLELQGHIWFVGAKERTLMYRGNRFFVHDLMRLS